MERRELMTLVDGDLICISWPKSINKTGTKFARVERVNRNLTKVLVRIFSETRGGKITGDLQRRSRWVIWWDVYYRVGWNDLPMVERPRR